MLKKLAGTGINLGVLAISILVFAGAFCAMTALGGSQTPKTITILAAAHNLDIGAPIGPSDLVEKTVYQDDNADLYIPAAEAANVVGGYAALPIFAGQPIYRNAIFAAAGTYRLSAVLSQYPDYSLFPLPLDATNVIAPDVSMFLPGDVVGVTLVIASRPQPPATQAAFNPLFPQVISTVAPTPEAVEQAESEAIDRTAPPLAKDLFPQGVIVVMVQGAPEVSTSPEGDEGASSTFTDFTTTEMLILLVPNESREEISLALQQGDRLVVSLLGHAGEVSTTAGYTYWDFEAWFEAEREESLGGSTASAPSLPSTPTPLPTTPATPTPTP